MIRKSVIFKFINNNWVQELVQNDCKSVNNKSELRISSNESIEYKIVRQSLSQWIMVATNN